MKTNHYLIYVLSSILCFAFLNARGDDTNKFKAYDDWQIELSKGIHYSVSATNGLKMGFYSGGFIPYPSDSPIQLLFGLTKKSAASCLYIPQDEYLGGIALFDTNNLPMRKTAAGERFKFLPLAHWDRSTVRQHHITGGRAPELWSVSYESWSRPLELPSPSQLFEIEKPGTYRLVLEFQVFLKTGPDKNVTHFPPLEIPVVKPEIASALTNGQNVQTNSPVK